MLTDKVEFELRDFHSDRLKPMIRLVMMMMTIVMMMMTIVMMMMTIVMMISRINAKNVNLHAFL